MIQMIQMITDKIIIYSRSNLLYMIVESINGYKNYSVNIFIYINFKYDIFFITKTVYVYI